MKQLKNKLLYWAVIVVIVGIIVLTGCQAKGTDADASDAGTTDEAAVDDVMDINEEPVVYEYHESGMEMIRKSPFMCLQLRMGRQMRLP